MSTFNVTAYGATGNGVTNDTAAITSALAALVDGAELYFPAGTYLINASAPVDNIFAISKKQIKVYGDGIGTSTIKIAAACAGYGAVFSSGAYDVTGLEFCDITFDHNVANNAITLNGIHAHPQISVSIGSGINLHIHDVEFINSTSLMHILLEADSGPMTGIVIEDITCSGVGDDPNHIEHDTSIIYTEADDVLIQNCDFTAASEHAPAAISAIETHGSDTIVQNNTITDFRNGINITGVARAGTSARIRVTGNHCVNLYGGIWIWSLPHPVTPSYAGLGIDGLEIDHNDFDLTADDSQDRFGIAFYWSNSLDINDVNIHDNTVSLSAIDSVPRDVKWSDYAIGVTTPAPQKNTNFTIADNVITNFPSNAIRFQDCDIQNVFVTGNTFIDCGSTLPASGEILDSPILVSAHAVDTLTFSGNAFIDDVPVTRIFNWFFLNAQATCTGLTISGNTYSMTGDKAAFVRPIRIYEDISQPLITETIADFVAPTHKVDPASTVTHGLTTWTVDATGLIWTSAAYWNDVIDLPQITVTGLSAGNAVKLYDSAGNVHASAVESGGTATLTYTLD